MKIWVDADACPVVIREILFRAAQRSQTPMTLVANHYLATPQGTLIQALQVSQGFDEADKYIAAKCNPRDLVITNDIPLADEVITKGATALSVRGERYTKENIKARLGMRNFMETMRASGVQSDGPSPLNSRDKQNFANQLDWWLHRSQH